MHSLLIRQLRKHLGITTEMVPAEWKTFIHAVDEAYKGFDGERNMAEISLDLSSQELYEANQKLLVAQEVLEQRVRERTSELEATNLRLHREISEREQMQLDLQASQMRFRMLVENTSDTIWEVDQLLRYRYLSPRVFELLGYQPEELIGRSPLEFMSTDEAQEAAMAFSSILADYEPYSIEYGMKTKNGAVIYIESKGMPMFDGNGNLVGYRGIDRDITSRRKAEQEIRRLSQILEATTDYVSFSTPEGEILYLNEAFRKLYSIKEGEYENLHISNFHPEWASSLIVNHILPYVSNKGVWRGEIAILDKGGEEIPVSQIILSHKNKKDEIEFYSTIIRDITEQKRSEESLRTAVDRAEALARAKSDFLATMSHEIRTPMNGVIGMTGLLLETALTPEQREYAETIRNSGDALLTIINDILDFSKIESGKLTLEFSPFSVEQVVEETLELLATKATEKRIDLLYSIDNNVPNSILGDITRLRQILLNLVGNAIKFTHYGEVVVSVTNRGLIAGNHEIQFSVRDTGIGIPQSKIAGLFEAFTQVDSSTTRKYGGTGLGLAISKRIVEHMGGQMWVTSEEHRGSTFSFTIRTTESHSIPQQEVTENHINLEKKRVLIVDDSLTNCRILTLQCENRGMISTAYQEPLAVLEAIRSGERYDIAIFDMHMPDIDGLKLARMIRALAFELKFSMPIVLLTSLILGAEDALTAKEIFFEVLSKPVKQSRLFDIISKALSGGRTQEQIATQGTKILDTSLVEKYPLRILLAEDNLVNQKLALTVLKKMGYIADLAANGLEVLDALERQKYDVVFMDVQMPEMDGIETTENIVKKYPVKDRPFIVAMTANAMEGDKERCLQAGMNDYVPKPIRLDAVREVIERIGRLLFNTAEN